MYVYKYMYMLICIHIIYIYDLRELLEGGWGGGRENWASRWTT